MKYEVTYFFSKTGQADEESGKFFVDAPIDCLEQIKKMKFDYDSLYLYSMDLGEKLQIYFHVKDYLVRDLMINGFYEKRCSYDELVNIIKSFDNPERDPLTYGMDSFG